MEFITFNIFMLIILGLILFMGGIIFANRNNYNNIKNNNQKILYRNNNNNANNDVDNNLSNNIMGNNYKQFNNRQNIQSNRCYEDGKITNLCAIIALKNIKRGMNTMLSGIEKDALDKAVDNTIKIEKLNAFVNNIDIENIDIDE